MSSFPKARTWQLYRFTRVKRPNLRKLPAGAEQGEFTNQRSTTVASEPPRNQALQQTVAAMVVAGDVTFHSTAAAAELDTRWHSFPREWYVARAVMTAFLNVTSIQPDPKLSKVVGRRRTSYLLSISRRLLRLLVGVETMWSQSTGPYERPCKES
jgi:hypothetical protein